MTTSEEAVNYILSRVARDVNFSWLMFGTEAMALCLAAESERTGKSRAEIESEITQSLKQCIERTGRDRPDVKIAEQKLESIRDKVGELAGYHAVTSANWQSLYNAIMEATQ